MEQFGILPYRFSAINGWNLSKKELENIGVNLKSDSFKNLLSHVVSDKKNGFIEQVRLNSSHIGKTAFSNLTSMGAVGCTLSHLSLLQDAYDAGYNNIWIMEDDIKICKNPCMLDVCITSLDEKVGKGNWDVLYTDRYICTAAFLELYNNKNYFFRPYFNSPFLNNFDSIKRFGDSNSNIKHINKNFIKIRCRLGTHSVIISRSGIEKILNFYKKHNMYLPYDLELSIIPEINLYCLTFDVVSTFNEISDTQSDKFSAFNK